jgi:hypothetical protein
MKCHDFQFLKFDPKTNDVLLITMNRPAVGNPDRGVDRSPFPKNIEFCSTIEGRDGVIGPAQLATTESANFIQCNRSLFQHNRPLADVSNHYLMRVFEDEAA